MLDATADTGRSFALAGPASMLKVLRQKLPAWPGRLLGRKGRRPHGAAFFGAILLTAMAGGILLNALFFQRTRHPAPLFAKSYPGPSAKRLPEGAGTGPHRPGSAGLPGEEVARTKQAEPQAAEKLPAAAVPGRKPGGSEPASRDQISALLQEGQAPSARSRAARPAKADTASDKKVLAAQRALVKLGFVLNPDGIAGAATRQAVERYERERGLPVRGALSPEILRRLSAESGLPVN